MFAQVFSALLRLVNYKLKSNQISGASNVEVKQLLETAKICSSNPVGPFLSFFRLSSVCFLSAYFPVAQLFSFIPSCYNSNA